MQANPVGAMVILVAMLRTWLHWADNDIFWHLASGRLMVEDGRFPNPDTFSWSAAGQTFVSYSAQVDRLFYYLWMLGGVPALGLFSCVAFALTLLPFALLVGRLNVRPVVELLTSSLIVLALFPFVGPRPQVVAFIISGVIVYLLERPFGWGKAVVVGVALGAWANLHGTFPVGFAIVGAGAYAWLWARDVRSTVAAGAALVLGFGLSLLSPYGLRLWYYPFVTVSNPYTVYNTDWTGLRPFTSVGFAVGILLIAAFIAGVWRVTDARSVAAVGLVLPAIQLARFSPFLAPHSVC